MDDFNPFRTIRCPDLLTGVGPFKRDHPLVTWPLVGLDGPVHQNATASTQCLH